VTLEEEIEERCIKVWAPLERLPPSVTEHFDVEVQEVEGCSISECPHLGHDAGTPLLKLRPKSGHRLIPLAADGYGSTYYALRLPASLEALYYRKTTSLTNPLRYDLFLRIEEKQLPPDL
jgi:hypothetical protein